jgi:hypothetical protein
MIACATQKLAAVDYVVVERKPSSPASSLNVV